MVEWAEWARYGLIFDAFSGVLFFGLGVLVLLARPRRAVATVFGLFAVGFGALLVFSNLTREPLLLLSGSWAWVFVAGAALLCPMIVWLGFVFPRRTARLPAWTLVTSLVAGVSFLALPLMGEAAAIDALAALGLPTWQGRVLLLGWFMAMGSIAFTAIVWSFRLPDLVQHGSQVQARSTLLASLALALFLALAQGTYGMTVGLARDLGFGPQTTVISIAQGFPFVAVWLVALLRAAASTERPVSKWCRNAALTVAATQPIAALFALATDTAYAADLGILGLARTAGFVVLAYLVLHDQILGVDVAFKWTLSRGTVAAIFLAVFFVVGSVASEWLVDRWGYSLGGVAAGLMLFAINPLQRVGERVADRALPNVKPLDQRTAGERAALYNAMVESAWQDGALSRAEGRVLDVARQRLGISLEQAHQIEAAVRG